MAHDLLFLVLDPPAPLCGHEAVPSKVQGSKRLGCLDALMLSGQIVYLASRAPTPALSRKVARLLFALDPMAMSSM